MGVLIVLALAVALCVALLLPGRLAAGRIEATGRPVTAPAVIRRSWAAGDAVNGRQQIGLALLVQPQGAEPFEVEISEAVASRDLAALQPGHVVSVCFLASDPERVTLVGPAAAGR